MFKKGHQLNLGKKRPDMIGNKFGFKKGQTPWNKSTKGIMKAWNNYLIKLLYEIKI